jgi:hypothetical protein
MRGRTLEPAGEYRMTRRAPQCVFAFSTDFSLLFGCLTGQLTAWAVGSGAIIACVEGVPAALSLVAHPSLAEIVAIVSRNSVAIGSGVVRTLAVPVEAPHIVSGTWDGAGLAFAAGDAGGGWFLFRPTNGDPSCNTTEHFFPTDFTPSEWDDVCGQVEEGNGVLVHQNARTCLVSNALVVLVRNYRPHPFTTIAAVHFPTATQATADIRPGRNLLHKLKISNRRSRRNGSATGLRTPCALHNVDRIGRLTWFNEFL